LKSPGPRTTSWEAGRAPLSVVTVMSDRI